MPTTTATPIHSFLFIDIVGYTTITEREGDNRAAEIATTLLAATSRAATEVGAEVVKSIGDAVMVRGHKAQDAISVALRVRRELATIPGFPAVHSGIHTGPAVCAGGDWFGNTVNLASRIADAAGAGEVLCSAETLAWAGEECSKQFVDCGERSFRNATPRLGVFSAEHTPPRFTRRPTGAPLATQVA
jgi:adenylate cyclase